MLSPKDDKVVPDEALESTRSTSRYRPAPSQPAPARKTTRATQYHARAGRSFAGGVAAAGGWPGGPGNVPLVPAEGPDCPTRAAPPALRVVNFLDGDPRQPGGAQVDDDILCQPVDAYVFRVDYSSGSSIVRALGVLTIR
jgi:hypothetical protein